MNQIDDVVATIHKSWAAAMEANDIDRLVSLYSADVLFYGSTPALCIGRDGVRAYFLALPKFHDIRVSFTDVEACQIGDVINVASICTAVVAGKRQATRMTHTLTREDSAWTISCHHASPCE